LGIQDISIQTFKASFVQMGDVISALSSSS